jgi:hypothetical protein
MQAAPSLEDPRYWLAHCEGFEVHDPLGFLGWVEEIEVEPRTGAGRALLVSPSHVHRGALRVPARSVRAVDPERGLVLVGSDGAAAHRSFCCADCDYRAGGATPPARCPMCGASSWDFAAAPR